MITVDYVDVKDGAVHTETYKTNDPSKLKEYIEYRRKKLNEGVFNFDVYVIREARAASNLKGN